METVFTYTLKKKKQNKIVPTNFQTAVMAMIIVSLFRQVEMKNLKK